MHRAPGGLALAGAAVAVALALSGCMTVQVNMPGTPAVAKSPKGSAKKLTAAETSAAQQEELRASVTEATRNKAAAVTKRWVQLMKVSKTSIVQAPAGGWYAAVDLEIPGMDPALFVYRRVGSTWKLLGYGARKEASGSRPLYGVPKSEWKSLLD
jgi:hypothetical protein